MATAVNGDDRERDVRENSVLYAYQCVPFVIALLFLTAVIVFGWCSGDKWKKQPKGLSPSKNASYQANIAAIVAVCSCVTVHNFVLDMLSLSAEYCGDLPSYYVENNSISMYTGIFAFLSLLCLMFALLLFCIRLVIWHCRARELFGLFFPIVLSIGSTVLSLSFHTQNIFIAWNIDPFYASRIALYYAVIIFVYTLTF